MIYIIINEKTIYKGKPIHQSKSYRTFERDIIKRMTLLIYVESV